MTTIEIISEVIGERTIYRAISGKQQATGFTPGQALDGIEQVMAAAEESSQGETIVIVQRFGSDNLFTAEEQARLQELMEQFHNSVEKGQSLPVQTQRELESPFEEELKATISRTARILQKTQPPQT